MPGPSRLTPPRGTALPLPESEEGGPVPIWRNIISERFFICFLDFYFFLGVGELGVFFVWLAFETEKQTKRY